MGMSASEGSCHCERQDSADECADEHEKKWVEERVAEVALRLHFVFFASHDPPAYFLHKLLELVLGNVGGGRDLFADVGNFASHLSYLPFETIATTTNLAKRPRA